jgi:hypothetical protein
LISIGIRVAVRIGDNRVLKKKPLVKNQGFFLGRKKCQLLGISWRDPIFLS